MPRSKKPRRKGGPKTPQQLLAEAHALRMGVEQERIAADPPAKIAAQRKALQDLHAAVERQGIGDELRQNVTGRKPRAPRKTTVRKPSPTPAQPARAPRAPRPSGPAAAAPRAASGFRRYGVPIAVGAAGVGTGAYLLHRHRRNNVGKGLIDPFTGESVVFEKHYIDDDYDREPVVKGVFIPGGIMTNVSTGSGRTREGQGVSHANKLTHVHNGNVRHGKRGALLVIRHGRRGVSGTSIGKMFSETGQGVGRKLLEI